MKKTFACILVLCVLVCGLVSLTACNGKVGTSNILSDSNTENTYDINHNSVREALNESLKNNQSNTLAEGDETEKEMVVIYLEDLGDTNNYSVEVEKGSTFKLPENLTKLGYTFEKKWQKKENDKYSDIQTTNNSIVANEELVLSAKWKIIEYNIEYNFGNGGFAEEVAVKETYTVEDLPKLLPIPKLDNNCFTGYKVNGSGQKIIEIKKEKSYLQNYKLDATYEAVDKCFEYNVVEASQTVEITSYIGNSNIIVVPDTIESKPVTSIGRYAFKESTNLTGVVVGDNVESIKAFAFKDCYKLETIIIGGKVTSIEAGSFSGCTSLEQAFIPQNVTSIGNFAFQYCNSKLIVYCEANSLPKGWSNSWCCGRAVWGSLLYK